MLNQRMLSYFLMWTTNNLSPLKSSQLKFSISLAFFTVSFNDNFILAYLKTGDNTNYNANDRKIHL